MAIKIFHTDSRFRADPATIILPPEPIGLVQTDDPDEAFALTQHGVRVDGPWWAHPATELFVRSTSVGDVMQLSTGERLVVAPVGFVPYEPPEQMTPRQLVAWARQKLCDLRAHPRRDSEQGDRLLHEAIQLLSDAVHRLYER
jgi:hypothetical protein